MSHTTIRVDVDTMGAILAHPRARNFGRGLNLKPDFALCFTLFSLSGLLDSRARFVERARMYGTDKFRS
jgi:hypothetical protein